MAKRSQHLLLLIVLSVALAVGAVFSRNMFAGTSVTYTGVNLAGADFGEGSLPGTHGVHYIYPTRAEVDYFHGKGMNVIRLPFRWERLQPTQLGNFDATELSRMDDIVSYATSKQVAVVLDPHNYARYYGKIIGQDVPVAAFADFWSKLAQRYKNNPRVIFGLMNEPHSMSTELWRDDANEAIKAIRATGATNLILVPGNAWSGAHSWNQTWYGTANATAMLGITDPGNNYAFEVHQYMDGDSSGTSETCVSTTIGAERLATFTAWLKQHGKRGFLGEFAGGRNQTCLTALDNMLSHIDANADVWLGWTYWAAGPWWGDYIFTVEPTASGDRPQMAPLLKHVRGSTPSVPTVTAQPATATRQPATATPSPVSATTTPSPVSATTTPSPAPSSGGNYAVQYQVSSQWNTGYNIDVMITNRGATPVTNWTISWPLVHGETLTNHWNAACRVQSAVVTCTNASYNARIEPNGGTVSFGGQLNSNSGGITRPASFTVNGVTVQSSSAPAPSPTATVAAPMPTATAMPVPTATTVPMPTATAAAPNPAGAYQVRYQVSSEWNTGYNIDVTLVNQSNSPVTNWTISWEVAPGNTIANAWNASCSLSGTTLTCTNKDYNATIGANGGSANFGAQLNMNAGPAPRPTTFTVNGVVVK